VIRYNVPKGNLPSGVTREGPMDLPDEVADVTGPASGRAYCKESVRCGFTSIRMS
jgi:hypothetical protein